MLLLWPFAAASQDGGTLEFKIGLSDNLTLQDVVKATLLRSPNNVVARAKENKADALSGRASSLFSDTPEISFNHQNDSIMSNQGLREWESSLDMPLWMPGQKAASRQKARMYTLEADAYQKLVILEATGQVREMFWEIKLADAGLQQSRNNLKMALALDRDITDKIAAGNLPKRDALLSQKEIMTRRMELITAEADYIHPAREYEAVTGLTVMPAHIDEVVNLEVDGENAPEIELAQAKVAFMEAEYKESKSSWSNPPKLSVGFKRETGSFLGRNINSLGVGLSIPLGAGVHMTSKRTAAALELAEADRANQILKREHRLHLHEAEHELEVCAIQLPFSKAHFDMATENLRLSQRAFDLGESDLLDLLKIQEQYFLSAGDNITKIIECKRAIARHNQIKGVLLP
ncbi:MAG: TolC family protein [Emcibacteraceae bacterium]|nr:TolC family protein [Emcibacteraceae bacterium]